MNFKVTTNFCQTLSKPCDYKTPSNDVEKFVSITLEKQRHNSYYKLFKLQAEYATKNNILNLIWRAKYS